MDPPEELNVEIEEVSEGTQREESKSIDWISLVKKEEELLETRLEKYNTSLEELRLLKRTLTMMNDYILTMEEGQGSYQVVPGRVFRTYEEACYKIMLDMLRYVVKYNRIVSKLSIDYDELKDGGAAALPKKLDEGELGVSDRDMEIAQLKYNRAEGKAWGVASQLNRIESFSEEDFSDRTSIDGSMPVVLGGRKKQVIRVEKSFTINTKTMAKLTNDKGELMAEPTVKHWVEFYQRFKETMKMNDKSDKESLRYLRQAIHEDLQNELDKNKERGFRSNSLKSCLLLLREIIFGPRWGQAMNKYFDNFRRKGSVSMRQFQRDFEKVMKATDYPRDGEIVRNKLERLLTKLEMEFLRKDDVDVRSSDWESIWKLLIKIHDSEIFQLLRREEKGKEPAKSEKGKTPFKSRRNLYCSYCKKKGHSLEECYLKDKPCYICKGTHLIVDCPKKEEKKGKCYICDSTEHTKRDCTKKGGGKYCAPPEGNGNRVAHISGLTYNVERVGRATER